MEEKTKHIARSVGVLSISTMISRILGYARDAMNAALFGAGYVSDAFFVAYRIPNMLRDLIAEGALSSAFIPSFVEHLENKGKEEAFRLANVVLSFLVIIFSIIIIAGILLAPAIVKVMAPGFVPDAVVLTVKLTRIIFPFIAFMGFASVLMGMLNSMRKFTIPALAPAFGNLVMIICGLFITPVFGDVPENRIVGWTLGALLSGLVQVLVQVPLVIKNGFKFKFILEFTAGVKKIGKLMVPALFSNSISQINIVLVNTVIASLLGPAVVTYLYYGFRLMQLPLGVFGVAIATASFPIIASHIAKNEKEGLLETLSSSVRLNFFITIPAIAGLIALSYPINSLLFHHGHFTAADTLATSLASNFYCLGITFVACSKVFTQTFFALNDSKTPVKIGIWSILVNIAFSLGLKDIMGFKGLALATSLSSLFNVMVLYIVLRKRIGKLDEKKLFIAGSKITLVSVMMGLLAFWLASVFNKLVAGSGSLHNAAQVFSVILVSVIFFVFVCGFFRVEEAKMFMDAMKRRFGRVTNKI